MTAASIAIRFDAMSGTVGLGWVIHTGWAVCVVAGGSLRAPRIEAREAIELLGDATRFVFHRAAEMPRNDAPRAVDEATAIVNARAKTEVARIVARVGVGAIHGAAIVARDTPMPEALDEILAAHLRLHAAEGCLYRDAIRGACEACDLRTRLIAPKDLTASAAKCSGVVPSEVPGWLAAAGRIAGPPWAKDQKDAALAAWVAGAS